MTVIVGEKGEKRDTKGKFVKGSVALSEGRPVTGVGKPISVLRRTLTKLRKLEDRAMEILEISMMSEDELEILESGADIKASNGKEYTMRKSPLKNQIDSAKFVIKQIESLTKSATTDEIAEMNLKELVFKDNTIDGGSNTNTLNIEQIPSFSLSLSQEDLEKHEELMEVYKPNE